MIKKFFKISCFKIAAALSVAFLNFFVQLLYGRSKIVYEGVVKSGASFPLEMLCYIFQILFFPINYINNFISKLLPNPDSFIFLFILIYLGYSYLIGCIIVKILKIVFKKEGIIK